MTAVATQTLDLPTDDTPIAVAAELYIQAGFSVVPVYGINPNGVGCTCRSPDCREQSWGKHPIGKRWQKSAINDLDEARDVFRGHRGNIGVFLGRQYLLVDIDGDDGYRSLAELGDLPLTLTSKSGSGGEHRIFAFASHQDPSLITNRSKILPGFDVKTREGQFVAAPSMHRSGQRYRWTVPIAPTQLPDSLYERIKKAPANVVSLRVPVRTDDAESLERRCRAYIAKIPPAISGSGGHDQTFAAARAIAGYIDKGMPESTAWNLFVEYNNACQPPWSERELLHKFTEAMKAHTKPALEDRPAPGVVVSMRSPDGPEGPTVPPPPGATHYRALMVYTATAKGTVKPVKHHENAIVVLRYHPEWKNKLRYDTHAQAVMVTDPPWHEPDQHAASTGERGWTDNDSARLSAWILREEQIDLSREACDLAVAIAAEAHPYHPVQEYFKSLTWDGTPRLHTAASTYFGADQSDYVASVFRWWMIAAVARTFVPGCKADNVLILEGSQGLKKSSALRVLASPRWFSDTPIDLQSKDAYLALNGKLIVELAELESLRKADASRAKSFFTSSHDTYRPPYGRRMVTVPRGCVFAGTVNHASYLQDTTGNRRYWPIACTAVDLEGLAAIRDQLWAEAAHWYHDGRRWWPDGPEELAMCEREQEPRAEGDEWETKVAAYLTGKSDTAVGDILADGLDIKPGLWTRADQMRVSAILQRLRWLRYKTTSSPRVWRYRVGTSASA